MTGHNTWLVLLQAIQLLRLDWITKERAKYPLKLWIEKSSSSIMSQQKYKQLVLHYKLLMNYMTK